MFLSKKEINRDVINEQFQNFDENSENEQNNNILSGTDNFGPESSQMKIDEAENDENIFAGTDSQNNDASGSELS